MAEEKKKLVTAEEMRSRMPVNIAAGNINIEYTGRANISLIEESIIKGQLITIPPQHMANQSELLAMAKDKLKENNIEVSESKSPIFLMSTMDMIERNWPKAMNVEMLPDGSPVIIFTPALHMATARFVEDILQPPDLGEVGYPRAEERFSDNYMNGYKNIMAKAGYSTLPAIFFDESDRSKRPSIAIQQTLKNEPYLIVNQAYLDLPTSTALGTIPHELTHFEKGHITAEAQAMWLNFPDIRIARERESDAGLKKLCDTSFGVDYFEHLKNAISNKIINDHAWNYPEQPKLSDAEVAIRVDNDAIHYPKLSERIAEIRQAPQNTPGCFEIKPDSTPAGRPVAGNKSR